MLRKILSIDGGGMRGVGAAHVLDRLDEALKGAGKRGVTEAFDMYVGTSTGCILAAGLAASDLLPGGPLGPGALVSLYYERGKDMFVGAPLAAPTFDLVQGRYLTADKQGVLAEILGGVRLGDLRKNFLATFYSLRPQPGAVFAQGGPAYVDNPYAALLLAEVVNASSNAPIYFDPSAVGGATYFGVDGGVFANNPAVCAYVEGRKMFPGDDILVVSLGCGSLKSQYPDWSRWGLLHWASPLNGVPILEVIFDAQATTVDHQMAHLLEAGRTYFRLQYDLSSSGPAPIDDVSAANLDKIVSAAEAYLAGDAGSAQLAAVVEAL